MTEQEKATKKKNVILIFITLMVTMLLASLSQMIFSSALPTIVGELNGVEHMTWVITAYLLASTITMPIYGKVSDLLGRKPLLLVAISLFIAGSIIGALAQDMNWLITSRVVQGLGGGGLMILSQAAVADIFPARTRGKYMGIMGGVFALSSIAGPLLGGWLTEGPGWRWAFLINIPLGILAIIAVITLMRIPKKVHAVKPRLDFLGMGLLSIATSAIVLTTTWGGSTFEWDSVQIISLIIGAIVSAILFVLAELRAEQPIIPMMLFKERNFVMTTIAALLVSVGMFGAIGYMPTYFQMVVGASASTAGLLMAPMMAAMLLMSIVSGAVVSKTGKYKFFPIAGTLILALGLGLLSTVKVETHTAVICLYMAIVGLGLGASLQILTLIVQNSFSHKIVGTATAANNYFRQVGGSLGSAIVGSIFGTRLAQLLAENLPTGVAGGEGTKSLTPTILASLPDAIRLPIIESYNGALIPVFAYMVPLALVACVVLFFVHEKELAEEVEQEVSAESLAEGQLTVTDYDETTPDNLPKPKH